MIYGLAADAVMALHLAFVLFVILGGIAVWRWPWVAALHVPAFVWGVLVVAKQWICPLTPLEQSLRIAAGEDGYEAGFMAHYIEPLIYPDGLPYVVKLFLAGLLTVLNVSLYWHAWYRKKKIVSA